MTGTSNDSEDFSDFSDEEIHDLSQEFTSALPDVLGQTIGIDVFRDIEESKRTEYEEDVLEQISELLIGFRDAMAAESEEAMAVGMMDVHSQMIEQYMMESEERQEFESGLEFLVEQLRISLDESREGMKELGYVEYFDLLDAFAKEIVENGQEEDVEELYDGLEQRSQQTMVQRLFNPVLSEYYMYLEDHPEISSAEEVRQYADIYQTLAELVDDILPQFIAVLQIANGREETYEDLSQMRLVCLLQKLEKKKYDRFNTLASGIDRELRNSIVHGDYLVNPNAGNVEFVDRGDLVAELSYSEFQEKVFKLLALFNALLEFRLMLTFYRIRHLPEAVENLRDNTPPGPDDTQDLE